MLNQHYLVPCVEYVNLFGVEQTIAVPTNKELHAYIPYIYIIEGAGFFDWPQQ